MRVIVSGRRLWKFVVVRSLTMDFFTLIVFVALASIATTESYDSRTFCISDGDWKDDEGFLCSGDDVIQVDELFLYDYSEDYEYLSRDSDYLCKYKTGDTREPLVRANPDTFVRVVTACDGHQSCEDFHVPDIDLSNGNDGDYIIMSYTCVLNTSIYHPVEVASIHSVSGLDCPSNRSLHVISAHYVFENRGSCPSNKRQAVEEDYLSEIVDTCDGHNSCDVILQTKTFYCGTFSSYGVKSVDVEIRYRCNLPTDDRPTHTITQKSLSTISPETSAWTDTSRDHSDDVTASLSSLTSRSYIGAPGGGSEHQTGSKAGMYVGVAVGAVVVVGVIILVVFFARRGSRKKRTRDHIELVQQNSSSHSGPATEHGLVGTTRDHGTVADPRYGEVEYSMVGEPWDVEPMGTPVCVYAAPVKPDKHLTRQDTDKEDTLQENVNYEATPMQQQIITSRAQPTPVQHQIITSSVIDDTTIVDNSEYAPWAANNNIVISGAPGQDRRDRDRVRDTDDTVMVDNLEYSAWA